MLTARRSNSQGETVDQVMYNSSGDPMNNNNGLRIGRFLIALGGVIGLIPILMSMKPYSFVYTLIILGLLIGGYFVWFNVKTYKQKEKEEESK